LTDIEEESYCFTIANQNRDLSKKRRKEMISIKEGRGGRGGDTHQQGDIKNPQGKHKKLRYSTAE